MPNLDRQTVLNSLEEDWGAYVSTLKALSPADQTTFLNKQGYRCLADLLAHVTAWWQDGMHKIQAFLQDPGYEAPPVDVDAFNASVVAEVRNQSEAAVIATFETTRLQFVELVQTLSDEDMVSPKIMRQLIMEVTGHYEDHQINE